MEDIENNSWQGFNILVEWQNTGSLYSNVVSIVYVYIL
jgi:hypothetical protein